MSAVGELRDELSDVEALLKSHLKKLPDLERLLSNVHALSSKRRAESHPDSRARIFDFDKLAKRKVCNFADLLEGMKSLMKLQQALTGCAPKCALLKYLCFKEKVLVPVCCCVYIKKKLLYRCVFVYRILRFFSRSFMIC